MAIKHSTTKNQYDALTASDWNADHVIEQGTITDADISATANIAQSKIANVGSDTIALLAASQELSNKTLNKPAIKDTDATPVGDRRLNVIDGIIKATDTSDVEGRYISRASIEQITDNEIASNAAIQESKLSFDTSAGHKHDGADSARLQAKDRKRVIALTIDALAASSIAYLLGKDAAAYSPPDNITLTKLTVIGKIASTDGVNAGTLTATLYKGSEAAGNDCFSASISATTEAWYKASDDVVNNAGMDSITISDTFFVKLETNAYAAMSDKITVVIEYTVD